jgi:hypothetical protein
VCFSNGFFSGKDKSHTPATAQNAIDAGINHCGVCTSKWQNVHLEELKAKVGVSAE